MIDVLFEKVRKEDKPAGQRKIGTESIARSFMKAFSWRVVGTMDTVIISFFVTGEIQSALAIGGVELISKMCLYFIHERIWNKVKWGI